MNTEQELVKEFVVKWQRVLRLQDWTVDVFVVESEDLQDNSQGEIHIHPPKRHAQIRILNQETREADKRAGRGMKIFPFETQEQSVIHELLHIYTEPMGLNELPNNDPKCIAMEVFVHTMATVLYENRT